MQYLDDDMSELFRKASKNIRLRPEDDDWDKIQGRLLPDASLLPGAETNDHKWNRNRLLAIAFFILGIASTTAVLLMNGKDKRKVIDQSLSKIRMVGPEEKPGSEYGHVTYRLKMNSLSRSSGLRYEMISGIRNELKEGNSTRVSFPERENFKKDRLPMKLEILKNTEINKQAFGSGNVTEKQIKKHKDPASEKGFYAGIIAGPQFSQTKQQGFGGAGFSEGLLVGFHLGRKMDIETGFIISNKQYVSAGEYFDMSKISTSMPSGMKLTQVQSKTTVFEIPVKFRYNVFKINQGSVFATGGLSSYIITRESNQYHVLNNGFPETLSGNYSTHQNYFAAAVNISAGYEWKVDKSLNFRVEPYLQIPSKAIGMGSMHVVSAGVYLGITLAFIK